MNIASNKKSTDGFREALTSGGPFLAMVNATRTPMVVTNPRLPDNPIVYANAAFMAMSGYSENEIVGKNCRFLQGKGTDPSAVERLGTAIAANEEIEVDLLNYRKDGSSFWNRLLVSPVIENETVIFFVASQQDVTLELEDLVTIERRKADLEAEVADRTAELDASEQSLRLALKAGKLGTWTIDLLTGELSASAECKSICGRAPDEGLTLDDLRASIHDDDRVLQVEAIDEAIENKSLLEAEYRLVTPAGDLRWVQIRGQAKYAVDGTPLSITGVTQDITARRQEQGHRALLARELNHRLKNTLASLQSIVSQTIKRSRSLDEVDTTLTARIHAMVIANDLLVTEDFGNASLRTLVMRTLAPFGVDDALRFAVVGEEIELPSNVVPAYSLALHELATNATKYGALSNDSGLVEVEWTTDVTPSGKELTLKWREKQGPTVTPPTKTSFGTQLIKRLLVSEAGGVADISYDPSGLLFVAKVPMN
ncbi:PAS domain-containing protein [Shinella sedimenti]|uniref:Blue-light-activated histidine kinase n=1 Tax=Shinella sedimenti TaxID=2919913 RepID=A0ABT0CTL5_9HYPH|nr:PAS domain-containing protein [Shinella sedimenti]MCJ8151941.1 PAS domain-containing protein [Shinella sedimenti]